MIRDIRSGEFAGAGMRNWSKAGGKIWATSGHVKSALSRYREWNSSAGVYLDTVPQQLEVVEVEVKPLRKAPAKLYVNGEACRHCRQPKKQHTKKTLKCLFESTTYELWEAA
jgi:hypothetical protein